jgi:leader peptidase (prepilin peptidase) / N-methyltransferase
MWLTIAVAGILGLVSGGAVNGLADALPAGLQAMPPRCPHCRTVRPAAAWLGLAALLLRGWRCPGCGARRGLRTAAVELAMLVGGVLLFLASDDWLAALRFFSVLSVFALILVIDLEHRLILHVVTGPAALLIGMMHILDPQRGLTRTLAGGAFGLAMFTLFYLLGIAFARWVSRRRGDELEEVAFGFGDVTLAGVIGLTVGWPGVVLALFLGVLSAGVFSLGYLLVMLARGRYTAFVPIPYGPFMLLGASIVYFGGRQVFLPLIGG